MAYQPPEGWVQVTRDASTREVYSQRLHSDRACAERAVAERLEKARMKGSPVECYLSDKMTYAEARRLGRSSVCKCVGLRRGAHSVNERAPFREILQRPPGSGRRG